MEGKSSKRTGRFEDFLNNWQVDQKQLWDANL